MADSSSQSLNDRISKYIEENGGQRVILAILALVIIQGFFVFDWVVTKTNEREVDLLVVRSDVERMEALSQLDGLDVALQSFEQRLGSYRQRVFKADTAGLAAAQIRTTLQTSIEAAELQNAQMTVNIEDEDEAKIVKFVIDLDARESERGDFAFFLANLAQHSEVFFVSRVDYRARNRTLRMRLECGAEIGQETA
ncbi:MAG: hypothetical protein AAF950_01265 [Pseudomonadota bacterium]